MIIAILILSVVNFAMLTWFLMGGIEDQWNRHDRELQEAKLERDHYELLCKIRDEEIRILKITEAQYLKLMREKNGKG